MTLGFFLSFLLFFSITLFVFARNLRSAVTFTTLLIFGLKALLLFITLVYFLVVCLNLPQLFLICALFLNVLFTFTVTHVEQVLHDLVRALACDELRLQLSFH